MVLVGFRPQVQEVSTNLKEIWFARDFKPNLRAARPANDPRKLVVPWVQIQWSWDQLRSTEIMLPDLLKNNRYFSWWSLTFRWRISKKNSSKSWPRSLLRTRNQWDTVAGWWNWWTRILIIIIIICNNNNYKNHHHHHHQHHHGHQHRHLQFYSQVFETFWSYCAWCEPENTRTNGLVSYKILQDTAAEATAEGQEGQVLKLWASNMLYFRCFLFFFSNLWTIQHAKKWSCFLLFIQQLLIVPCFNAWTELRRSFAGRDGDSPVTRHFHTVFWGDCPSKWRNLKPVQIRQSLNHLTAPLRQGKPWSFFSLSCVWVKTS